MVDSAISHRQEEEEVDGEVEEEEAMIRPR